MVSGVPFKSRQTPKPSPGTLRKHVSRTVDLFVSLCLQLFACVCIGVFLTVGIAVMNLILGVVVNVAMSEHDRLGAELEEEAAIAK